MPELPEVETICRSLSNIVVGKKVVDVSVRWDKIIKHPDVTRFSFLVKNQMINRVSRRGKFILFYLDDFVLVSHLRMEGKYGVFECKTPLDKHDHVIFHFSDGCELRYKDVRKFGTMHLHELGREFSENPLAKLGLEPFSLEYTPEYLSDALKNAKRKIKAVLLDQEVVVGLGNIYVDEALFSAGIHPERAANTLTFAEICTLHKKTVTTLTKAIEAGGSTIRTYMNSLGEIGSFQLQIQVYGKGGQPCPKCGTILEKTKVSGRGTVFCRKCQT